MTPITLYHPSLAPVEIQYPSSWDELSAIDMVIVAESYFEQKYTPVEVCIKLIEYRLTAEQARLYIPMLSLEDVSMEYSPLTEFLRGDITRTIPITISTGYCPQPDFDDTTAGIFEEADVHLSTWLQHSDPDQLIQFFKTWYKLEYPSPVNPSTLKAIALCFIGCKNNLKRYFPLVFNAPAEGEANSSAPDALALTRLIHHAAGPKNGTREQIRKTLIKEFLFDCQLEAEKAPDVY